MRAARRRAARRAYSIRAMVASALVAFSVWWMVANVVPGGAILVSVSERHGLDAADLLTLPLLALAAWLVWPRRRRRTPMATSAARDPESGPAPEASVLLVCSANQCRSPMAAELLDRRLQALGVPATVRSAGTSAAAGLPALDEARAAVGGLDGHRAVTLVAPLVEDADLVLGVTRHHVREAILLCPGAFTRTFTVLELARRGRSIGSRSAAEPIAEWLARAGSGRTPADLAGSSVADEVPDPIGYGAAAVAGSADELRVALDEIADLMWGAARNGRPRGRAGRSAAGRSATWRRRTGRGWSGSAQRRSCSSQQSASGCTSPTRDCESRPASWRS